jgi:two-component sensor histidine kinase
LAPEGRRAAPSLARDIAIGSAIAAVTFGIRSTIDMSLGGVTLFALVYPAIAAAALLSTWRAGLVVLLICQTSIWYLLMPPPGSFKLLTPADAVSLLLSTFAQLVLLWIVHRYQTSRDHQEQLEELRRRDLETAMEELDHRAMNNFQLAIAILRSQASRSTTRHTEDVLETAIGRLNVLAAVHGKLARSSTPDMRMRALAPLIDDILAATRAHAAELPGVSIDTSLRDVIVPSEHALRVGLIVNELATNALKYAFPDGPGHLQVNLEQPDGGGYRVRVSDNGIGLDPRARKGTGSRLLPMLAKSVGGELVTLPGPGTTVELRVPAAMGQRHPA